MHRLFFARALDRRTIVAVTGTQPDTASAETMARVLQASHDSVLVRRWTGNGIHDSRLLCEYVWRVHRLSASIAAGWSLAGWRRLRSGS